MESSQIRVSFVEDEEERHIFIPRLHMDPDTIVQRLSRRFSQRSLACGRSNGAQEKPETVSIVEDIMATPVITVGLDEEAGDMMDLMKAHRIRHLAVVENDRLRGIVSDRDILEITSPFIGKAAERKADLDTQRSKAHQFMTREVVTIEPSASLCLASTMMDAHRIHCLPVVEKEALVGIITSTDLLAALCVIDPSYQ
ncbi:MAG TPA: CBS domain-containing protein [Acidobacteriota bacterium]|nr:CBS domain-containing protein [Acidobacteriota bacterium]